MFRRLSHEIYNAKELLDAASLMLDKIGLNSEELCLFNEQVKQYIELEKENREGIFYFRQIFAHELG